MGSQAGEALFLGSFPEAGRVQAVPRAKKQPTPLALSPAKPSFSVHLIFSLGVYAHKLLSVGQ